MATVSKTTRRRWPKPKATADGIVPDYELVESDGEPLDTAWHRDAISLLIDVLSWQFRHRTNYYVGGNMFIYFSPRRSKQSNFRGPDFFYVDDVPLQPPRRYWVVWEEGDRFPDFILELLSPKTARHDRTIKKKIYEQTFQTHEYCLYDPDAKKLQGYRLNERGRYQAIQPDQRGWLWIEKLGLWLGVWHGKYLNTDAAWPRFFDSEGRLIPTANERAENAEAELRRLKARLRNLEKNGPHA